MKYNLIDRDRILRTCDSEEATIGKDWDYDALRAEIELSPVIDAEPVRHGRWIYEIDFENEANRNDWDLMCTECGTVYICENDTDAQFYKDTCVYCPNCGTKMDLEGN